MKKSQPLPKTTPTHQPPPPEGELVETRGFWQEVGKDLVRKSSEPIDETAKQIIGATTILEGLYFNAIAFSNLHGKVSIGWSLVIYMAPIGLLLISLSAALLVFFPKRYPLNFHSSEASRLVYEYTVNRKLRSLMISAIFLVLGIASLFLAVLIYLMK
jgi:hypothetical protein